MKHKVRNGLADFIHDLEAQGELVRVKEYVNPELEIPEIVDRISKSSAQNKAILFENNGTDFPLLINSLGSEKRMSMALYVEQLDDISARLKTLFTQLSSAKSSWMEKLSMIPKLREIASFMPSQKKGRGVCQEVIHSNPSLDMLPILKCWPADGGKFITLPIIHTKHLGNSTRNVGMYRMQVYDGVTTGMHWHLHKVSAKHFHDYRREKQRMPVAVSLGGDPVYTYCATAPLPENVDEYILAGFLRKKKVQLVPCVTQPDVHVPADSDIVIEGYIDPNEPLRVEGPFGDHTGYYSLEDLYPTFHITCITHRHHAIYPATIVGIPPQEDAWIGKATERIFLAPIQLTMLPEIRDMAMPVEGVFHNLVLISLQKEYLGQAIKCINSLWGAGQMMLNKVMIAMDESVDLHQPLSHYIKEAFHRFNPATDCVISRGPLDVLDHSSQQKGYGGKLGIDLTSSLPEEMQEDGFYFRKITKSATALFKGLNDEAHEINIDLLKQGIPLIVIAVKKESEIKSLIKKMTSQKAYEGVKLVLFLDYTVDIHDVSLSSWVALNHIDPARDVHIKTWTSAYKPQKQTSCLFVDATSKVKRSGFMRDWPNPVASDSQTIQRIDSVWDKLSLGQFISSPSLKVLGMHKGSGAYFYKHKPPKPRSKK